jgi:exodeoxyribonuclease-1
MSASFYFYDLETTGISPRSARIMQFAGQRTDMDLNPIGEPTNILIKLTPDVVPEPDAIFITHITPQKTIDEGVSEVEFLQHFYASIVQPDTIFVGFNNVRFDDEFMRFLLYRNFYDPYEWEWANGCSRWDILDVIRMARALRPEGINWPVGANGKPTNRLELMTKLNKLDHYSAHDALSDVLATIAVAKLLKDKQPELYGYLLNVRDKKSVSELIMSGKPIVYTSGHYSSDHLHTSAAVLLAEHPQSGAALMYDLRTDPTPFLSMSVDELKLAWQYSRDPNVTHLPVKTVKFNRCPAVAPLGVVKDDAAQERINLRLGTISKHLAIFEKHKAEFAKKLLDIVSQLDVDQAHKQIVEGGNPETVDARLYENFISSADKPVMSSIRTSAPEDLASYAKKLHDERLKLILPLYKARNYPSDLDSEERSVWDAFCKTQLFDGADQSRLAKYFARLQELASGKLTSEQEFLLEEMQLYGQSVIPAELN